MFPEIPNLYKAVYELLIQIPKGKVSTYKAVAEALGDKIAARAVGKILSENNHPDLYPCYRVVYSDGKVGNYRFGGTDAKSKLLTNDGIEVSGDKIVGFDRYFFDDFVSDRPLARLLDYQKRFIPEIESITPIIETVGGVDVSYSDNSAVAVYTLFDFRTNSMIEYVSQSDKIYFPYIPGYLSFRELPILSKLIDKVKRKKRLADVVLVDGNGIIHPRASGIASMLGAVCGIKTVGVAKSLLCGTVGDDDFVRIDDKIVGKRVTKGFKPLFVSSGWNVELTTATEIVADTMIHRLAEPLRMAHIISRAIATDYKNSSS